MSATQKIRALSAVTRNEASYLKQVVTSKAVDVLGHGCVGAFYGALMPWTLKDQFNDWKKFNSLLKTSVSAPGLARLKQEFNECREDTIIKLVITSYSCMSCYLNTTSIVGGTLKFFATNAFYTAIQHAVDHVRLSMGPGALTKYFLHLKNSYQSALAPLPQQTQIGPKQNTSKPPQFIP